MIVCDFFFKIIHNFFFVASLLNSVPCVRQSNLFWQRYPLIRLCLSIQVRPARKNILLPFGDFKLFEGLTRTLFKTWLWNMTYFWNGKLFFIIAVLVKAALVHCPLEKLEVNKDGFQGASCLLAILVYFCSLYTLGKNGCYTPGWCFFFVIISVSSVREV